MRVRSHRRRLPVVLALLAVVALLGVAWADPSVALILAPPLALLVALAVGVFPGEQAIARARARRMRPRPVRGPARIARPRLADVRRPAGVTRAYALAVRPPPIPG
jgi:hypothetical protein